MKFTNIKKNYAFLAMLSLLLCNSVITPANAAVDKRIECGRKVGITLAQCLFIPNNNLTFLDDLEEFRKIINEYCSHFDQATVDSAMQVIDEIEAYIKMQRAQKKYVNPNKVASYLQNLIKSLPENVSRELTRAFELQQVKILKRTKPLGNIQLLAPLSSRLNNRPTGA